MQTTLKHELVDIVYGALISRTARAVRRERMTYLSTKKLLNMERELRRIKKDGIPGDYVEFGIALGGSAVLAASAMDRNRRFHGFDVFGMIPPPESEKDDIVSRDRYAVIQSGQSKGIGGDIYYGYRDDLFTEVVENFRRHGIAVDQKRVSLHKGLFQDTWPAASAEIGQIAFGHIDCDWYEPVKYCFDAIAERVSPGGAIVVDDYNDYGGCRTATEELLRMRPEFQIARNSGSLILRKS
jgi:asparagine synthase (glutamine-hydrolysing)